MNDNLDISEHRLEERQSVTKIIKFFEEERDFNKVIYTEWTSKDILGHIVFWHESFARNVLSVIENTRSNLIKGTLAEANERGVKEMSKYSIEELLDKLRIAQIKIDLNIENKDIRTIKYRQGSREYTPIEHLDLVKNHLEKHLEDMKKKYR